MDNITGKYEIFQLDTDEKTVEQEAGIPALIKRET